MSEQRRLARPDPQAAPDVGRSEPAAGLGEEQRRALGARREGVAAELEVARHGPQRGLGGVEPERAHVEADELGGIEPVAAGELEHGAVAQLQRGRRRDPVQQPGHLVVLEHRRGVRAQLAVLHQHAVERPGAAASIEGDGLVLHRDVHGSGRHAAAARGGRDRSARRAAQAPLAPDPGHPRCVHHVVRGAAPEFNISLFSDFYFYSSI